MLLNIVKSGEQDKERSKEWLVILAPDAIYLQDKWNSKSLRTSPYSSTGRALDLKTGGCGSSSLAGQPNNYYCLSDEPLNSDSFPTMFSNTWF